MFYRFLNKTTGEVFEMPVEVYSSPKTAYLNLLFTGAVAHTDQVEYLGLVE